jgi:ubiquinone/menaquinone biosynthesis C-methylase UbiE
MKIRADHDKEKVYEDAGVVDTYDKRLYFGRSGGRFFEEEARLIEDWFPSQGAVLDIPCGTGKLGRVLKNRPGLILTGCDISEKMLEKAALKGTYAQLSKQNMASMTFPDKTFSVVYVSRFFMLFDDISPFLREIRRVMKDDGILIFDSIRRSIHNLLHAVHGTSEGWNHPRSTQTVLKILHDNGFAIQDRRSRFLVSTGIMNRLPVALFNQLIRVEKILPEFCRVMEVYKVAKR